MAKRNPTDDAARLIERALDFCQVRGWPVRADAEYTSAVNWAVCQAIQNRVPAGYTRAQFACLIAVRECIRTRLKLKRWARHRTLDPQTESTQTKVSLGRPKASRHDRLDDELLSFVAAVGMREAQRLLEVTRRDLVRMLRTAVVAAQRRRVEADEVGL